MNEHASREERRRREEQERKDLEGNKDDKSDKEGGDRTPSPVSQGPELPGGQ